MSVVKSTSIHAYGEDEIDFDDMFPAYITGLAERRLNKHAWLTSIIIDFGTSNRLMIQSKATDFDDEDEFGILSLRLIDRVIENEKAINFKKLEIQRIERATTTYKDKTLTVGIRIYGNGDVPVDILCGSELCSLAVYGWGFPKSDQISEFPLDKYKFEPWN